MQRISPVNNFDIDIKTLIKEYKSSVKGLMEDVVTHQNSVLVQKKFHVIRKNVENDVLSNMPYTQEIAKRVCNIFEFKDMTYRVVMPNTAYNWHMDNGLVYHIPLITNVGCHFVYDNESYVMPAGPLYAVHNGVPHTFVNAGREERLHLTFEIL